MAASPNPFRRGSRGWGVFIYGNHAARRENGTSWWGRLCDVCFASKKSSEREFFVPAGTHLAVKLLRLILLVKKIRQDKVKRWEGIVGIKPHYIPCFCRLWLWGIEPRRSESAVMPDTHYISQSNINWFNFVRITAPHCSWSNGTGMESEEYIFRIPLRVFYERSWS